MHGQRRKHSPKRGLFRQTASLEYRFATVVAGVLSTSAANLAARKTLSMALERTASGRERRRLPIAFPSLHVLRETQSRNSTLQTVMDLNVDATVPKRNSDELECQPVSSNQSTDRRSIWIGSRLPFESGKATFADRRRWFACNMSKSDISRHFADPEKTIEHKHSATVEIDLMQAATAACAHDLNCNRDRGPSLALLYGVEPEVQSTQLIREFAGGCQHVASRTQLVSIGAQVHVVVVAAARTSAFEIQDLLAVEIDSTLSTAW